MQPSVLLRVSGEVYMKNWHGGSLCFSSRNNLDYILEIHHHLNRNSPIFIKQFTPSQLKHIPPRRNAIFPVRQLLYFTFEDSTMIKIRCSSEARHQLVRFLNDITETAHGNSFPRMRGNSPYARTYAQQQFNASRRNNYLARRGPVVKSPTGHRMTHRSPNSLRHMKDNQDVYLEVVDDRSKPPSISPQNFFRSSPNSARRNYDENRPPLKLLTSNANHDHVKRPKQLDLDASKRPKLSSDHFAKEGGQLGGQLVKELPPQKLCAQSEGEGNSFSSESSPYTGFPNIGNSCFMNSVLQSLLQLRCISDDLESTRHVLEKNLPEQSIIRYLLSLLSCPPEECQKLLGQTLEVISNSSPCFADGQQHDALEFLVQLLDVIKEEVKKASGGSGSPDPVTNNIEFKLGSSYMCLRCQKIISRKEVLHMLSLNVPNLQGTEQQCSLSDALKDYFEPQEIEMKCEHCSGTSTKCVQSFSTLPRVLVFHLKRYTYLDGTCKIMCPVQVPIQLSLEDFVTDQVMSFEQSINSIPSPSIAPAVDEEVLLVSPSTNSSTNSPPISSSPESSSEKEVQAPPVARPPIKLNTTKCSTPGRKGLNGLRQGNPNVPIVLKGGSDSANIASPIPGIASDVPSEKTEVNVMETISEETEEEQFEKVLKMSRESAQSQEDKELIEAMNRSVQDISCKYLDEYEVYQEEPSANLSDSENISSPFSYQLASIVSHIGHNADTGHYVANYFDTRSGQWWHFNDEVVHRKSKHSVMESIKTQGYLFFYIARDSTD